MPAHSHECATGNIARAEKDRKIRGLEAVIWTPSFIYLFFLFEREREHKRGRSREREKQRIKDLKQALR